MHERYSAMVIIGSLLAVAGLTLAFMWTYYGNKLQRMRDAKATEVQSEHS
jgi:hypothetical protein